MPPDHPPSGQPPKLKRPRLRAPGAGRPRKSAALHLIQGTRSRAPQPPTPLNERPVAAADLPRELLRPPSWLHKFAKAFWRRRAPMLAAAGRLKVHHLDAWTGLCERYGTWERASRSMNEHEIGTDEFSAAALVARQAWQQVLAGCLRFGIDPAADHRLSTLDGSDVGDQRPAAVAPATAAAEDRGDVWLRAHGDGG